MLQIARPQMYCYTVVITDGKLLRLNTQLKVFLEWLYFDARMKGLVVLRPWVQVKHSITTVEC